MLQKTYPFFVFILFTGIFGIMPVNNIDAQADTTVKKLKEVNIHAPAINPAINSPAAIQLITHQNIESLPALQLSDVLKFMSGVVIKDYGGTGGMKTVSVRGLGTQHTGVAYDLVALTDCQTGQIDLGKLSMENVENVSLITGPDEDVLLPARLFSYSNLLKINTSKPHFDKPLHLMASLTLGDYGLVTSSIYCENLLKNKKHPNSYFAWNLFANYLHSDGDYRYTLHYGGVTDSVSRECRQNADVTSFNAEVNTRLVVGNKHFLLFKWYYYDSERGLPSATVFYNLNSTQRLWNRNTFGQLSYRFLSRKWSYMLNGKINYDYTHYLDPDYLNVAGFLDNRYRQYEGYLSNTVRFTPIQTIDGHQKWSIALSNDFIFNQLNANTLTTEHPQRFTSLTSLASFYRFNKFSLNGNLLFTAVVNHTQISQDNTQYLHLSPTIGAAFDVIRSLKIRAFYKNIFRMPTFNDLYYREVGNLNLQPEKTQQLDFGISYEPHWAYKVQLSAVLDGYYNIVKDKIVAFPSHNLFSWTMLNYGKVHIGGTEVNLRADYSFVKDYALHVWGNCTYQKAVDRTDSTGKTYNQQIPYTPIWSGSVGIGLQLPWLTITYSLIYCGERYALGQNIPANVVAAYVDQSLTLSHEVAIKEAKIGFKFELLNLGDVQYEIIRNYPMQGAGCRLKFYVSY